MNREITVLNIRLAITILFVFTQISVLALSFSELGLNKLLGSFVVFSGLITVTIVFTLAFPHRQQIRWLPLSFVSAVAYLALILLLQHWQHIPIPSLTIVSGQLASIVLISALVCWVQNCLSEFESSVIQLGLHDPLTNLNTPAAEERIQSMLMNSRYTGQPIGLIAIDTPADAQQYLQTKLIKKIQLKMAAAHWQSLVVQNLHEETRLIDRFYKDEKDDRLILVCPGMSGGELSEMCQQLTNTMTEKLDTNSVCRYVSFPQDALTFDALLSRLSEKNHQDTETTANVQTLISLPDSNVPGSAADQESLRPSQRAAVNSDYLE